MRCNDRLKPQQEEDSNCTTQGSVLNFKKYEVVTVRLVFALTLTAHPNELVAHQSSMQININGLLSGADGVVAPYRCSICRKRISRSGRLPIAVSTLVRLAARLQCSVNDLLTGDEATKGKNKRGPASKLQQQIEQVRHLPRAKQKFVIEMLDTVIQQAVH